MDVYTIPDILAFILSVCAIAITGAVVIGVYTALGVIKDFQLLIHSLHGEIENFRMRRQGIEVTGKTIAKVARLFLMRALFKRR
jgi:hypothetical protein